jgi:ABC-type amino acid transport substrate-binding protein
MSQIKMLPIFAIILAVGIMTSKAAKQNLTVLMILKDPYLMHKDYDGQLDGEYEGFSVDLLKLLEEELKVPMSIRVIDNYGVYEESSEKWTGMVGELADGSADMAIADLTVTEAREEAIDFSIPFMRGGITILSKKPINKEPYFSFLDPFTLDYYCCLLFDIRCSLHSAQYH